RTGWGSKAAAEPTMTEIVAVVGVGAVEGIGTGVALCRTGGLELAAGAGTGGGAPGRDAIACDMPGLACRTVAVHARAIGGVGVVLAVHGAGRAIRRGATEGLRPRTGQLAYEDGRRR